MLFDISTDNISLHLRYIHQEGDLDESATTEESSVVRQEGKLLARGVELEQAVLCPAVTRLDDECAPERRKNGLFFKKRGHMAHDKRVVIPDNTAVRTALWRALHVQEDALPHVLEDEVGLKLIAPDDDWRNRPDMSPFTKPFRAGILARARFIEDLIEEQVSDGMDQYVLLGAGLDSFAQRRTELRSRLRIFELDQPDSREWKRQRLLAIGFGVADHLKLVPVDFEAGDDWMEQLVDSGFDAERRAVIASMGVSMYLTQDAIVATLRKIATLAPHSIFVMSFLCPIEMLDPEMRVGVERAANGARASGTPWLSFFTPDEIMALASEAGFKQVRHVSAEALGERYFAGRADGLHPSKNSEELLVATV